MRLGIKAPSDTPIHRQEVYEKILDANRQASSAAADDLDRLSGILDLKKGANV